MKRSIRRKGRTGRRRSRRSRKSLLLVFALVFAAASARPARAACVEFAQPPAISTVALSAVSVVAGDVDGDGDLDVLSASYNDNKIAWYVNNGTGTVWSARTISAAALGATSVAIADIDRDGDLDALSSSFGDSDVTWYENLDGTGASWSAHDIANDAYGPQSVDAADMDGDGDPDALVAQFDGGRIVWYQNDGSGGGWAPQTVSNLSYGVSFASAADVNGDGELDVVSSSSTLDRIAWHQNYGGGVGIFGLHVIATEATGAQSASAFDLDGDGDLDVVAASFGDNTIAWYESVADGTSWVEHAISTLALGANEASAFDLDGDGDGDVLSASATDGKIAWYENNGSASAWTVHTISTGASGAAGVFAADLDADGDLDALSASTSNNTIAWYRNDRLHDAALYLPAFTISDQPNGVRRIAPGDVDGDGDLDVVVAGFWDDAVAWHQSNGAGTVWTIYSVTTLPLDGPFDAKLVDIDRDGDLDVLAAAYYDPGRAVWFANSGDGSSWALRTISPVDQNTFSVAAADLDRDGDPDVLAGTSAFGVPERTLSWWENDGTGTSWTVHSVQIGLTSHVTSAVAADVDGDGDLDAVSGTYQNSGADILAWHENNGLGTGSWTIHTLSTALNDPHVDAADLDGDGDVDVLSGTYEGLLALWYENLGSGASWTTHTLWTSAFGLLSTSAADLDGDGDLDALAAFCYGQTLLWFENNGTDSGWSGHTLASGEGNCFTSAAAADVDGDGDLDVAFAELNSRIGWIQNLGTGVFDDGFDSDASKACWSGSVP